MTYCVSPKSLVSISLPSDELPAFFNVSPTIIILDFSALPYQIKIEESQTNHYSLKQSYQICWKKRDKMTLIPLSWVRGRRFCRRRRARSESRVVSPEWPCTRSSSSWKTTSRKSWPSGASRCDSSRSWIGHWYWWNTCPSPKTRRSSSRRRAMAAMSERDLCNSEVAEWTSSSPRRNWRVWNWVELGFSLLHTEMEVFNYHLWLRITCQWSRLTSFPSFRSF